jgi:hypothetical protein
MLVILIVFLPCLETYIWRRRVALKVGLDGAVLLVEQRHVGHEVLDDVHVGERVDAGFLGGVCGNAACSSNQQQLHEQRFQPNIHRHASVLTPSMFIAQLPQIPSLQLRLNVKVGSTSFLILMSASNIMGPVLFRSSWYDCILGFEVGSSGFHR